MASGTFSMPGSAVTCDVDRYASDAPMLTVPLAASATPVPEPVDPVVTVTSGHCVFTCATHKLNRGKRRLDPVSCSVPAEVGQFSGLAKVAAAAVVGVLALVVAEGVDELHAAINSPATPITATTLVARNRPDTIRRFEPPIEVEFGRVDIRVEISFRFAFLGLGWKRGPKDAGVGRNC